MKSHGEIAAKGLTNYVYDADNSIKSPSADYSKRETVCASKSSETQENTATLKTNGSLKQDHWILDRKNKQLIRVHITPRKALFTPTGAKECPINPDNISRERTTESIDASKGGDPDILEDNCRFTSQANKSMVNLWIGKTMFTFADNLLKDEESGSGSAADRIIDKKGRPTIEPDSTASSADEPTSLPLTKGRMHQRLSKPEELKKLHLEHHHMTTDQFRFRTRALHLPKSTHDLFDKIRSECEVKHAPPRSKTSGVRADTFGDRTFIDHCQIPLGTGEHIIVFVILNGATSLSSGTTLTSTTCSPNQLLEIKPNQAFMTETWEHFYQSLNSRRISDRTQHGRIKLKAQLKIMLNSIKARTAPATLKRVSHRQVVKLTLRKCGAAAKSVPDLAKVLRLPRNLYLTLRKCCACREICTGLAKVLRLPQNLCPTLQKHGACREICA